MIDRRPMLFWLLDTIRKWYHHWNCYASSFDDVLTQMNYWK
ncbi:hypothetical protein [Planococcus versutus]|nr:hypothetical protein [Planococcus versutus]